MIFLKTCGAPSGKIRASYDAFRSLLRPDGVENILNKITAMRESRGWTEYQLAESSVLPQSTISSWYRKNMVPSVPSLAKICSAFGITLSQLFAADEGYYDLSNDQKELLEHWACLNPT